MTDYKDIYQNNADQYDLLVSREDNQKNLLRAIGEIRNLDGLDVIELGAGTGRLTCMVAPVAKSIRAFDSAQAMTLVAEKKLSVLGLKNWTVGVADNRNIPCPNSCADVSLAGWTLGHCTSWYPESWRDEIGAAINEMLRVLKPGGTAIILETLGTGYESPTIPNERLKKYYAYLENDLGFQSSWTRTDYKFKSPAEGEMLTRFFFGDSIADKIVSENATILPECTGLWWKTA